MKKLLFALIASIALCAFAQAQVRVTAPWIRATVPQQKASGAFMQLLASQDMRLVDVHTPVGNAEIHQMAMSGQTMTMHPVEGIDLPAGQTVTLGSGGYHIMLTELKRQLKADEVVPLTLTLQDKRGKRSTIKVDVPVKPLAYSAQ